MTDTVAIVTITPQITTAVEGSLEALMSAPMVAQDVTPLETVLGLLSEYEALLMRNASVVAEEASNSPGLLRFVLEMESQTLTSKAERVAEARMGLLPRLVVSIV